MKLHTVKATSIGHLKQQIFIEKKLLIIIVQMLCKPMLQNYIN